MIRYSAGIRKWSGVARALAAWQLKRARGFLTGCRIYRPPVDHGLYRFDNARLSSTYQNCAAIQHRVSLTRPWTMPTLVEVEHAFALVGHVNETTRLDEFRARLPERFAEVAEWFRVGPHRIVATSEGARRSISVLESLSGVRLDASRISVLYWAAEPRAPKPPNTTGPLVVFHSGGSQPVTKGTLDVIDVALRLPSVTFLVATSPEHPAVRSVPSNLRVVPFIDQRSYLRALGAADVLLAPVYSDGWGVCIDAMARGLPIVSYDSYDKAEVVDDGVTGTLVHLPPPLSWYDGFLEGSYRSWQEYTDLVKGGRSDERVEALTAALAAYDADRALLDRQSMATTVMFRRRHDVDARVQSLRALYGELFDAVGVA